MTRLALIAVNAKYSHTNLALLYLSAALSAEGVDFNLIEWDINRPKRELLETIVGGNYSHAVFSVYIWNSIWVAELLSDLSQLRKRPICCVGGPEAVFNRRLWLEKPGLDFILDGAAEHFAAGLPELDKPDEPLILRAEPAPFTETVFPYSSEALRSLHGRLIYYEASRGCRFGCSYCLSGGCETVEYRTIAQIRDEIELLGTFPGTVKFVDRTFNANKEISRFIWHQMAEHPPLGCFHFEIHPLLLEDEDLKLLDALPPGSVQLEIGIQSTSPEILKNVNRAGNWRQEREVISRLIDTGRFHIHLDQITGLPGDTPETAAESLNRIMKLKPDNFQLGFLKVLPGTSLQKDKDKWGIRHSAAPPYEILENDSFSFTELRRFHRIEKLISRIYNSGYFRLTLNQLSTEADSWFALFTGLLETAPDLDCRRWEYWCGVLLDYIEQETPEDRGLYIDLLRFEWCPFAGSQYYPERIRYSDGDKIHDRRKHLIEKIRKENPEIRKSVLNRAILYCPECRGKSGTAETLFFKDNGRKCRIETDNYQL